MSSARVRVTKAEPKEKIGLKEINFIGE